MSDCKLRIDNTTLRDPLMSDSKLRIDNTTFRDPLMSDCKLRIDNTAFRIHLPVVASLDQTESLLLVDPGHLLPLLRCISHPYFLLVIRVNIAITASLLLFFFYSW